MTSKVKARTAGLDTTRIERLPATLFAAMLGAFMFYGVAFAQPAEIHNAAHDGRHSFSFPCH